MISASRRAGEFLVDRKVLSRDDLEEALKREEETGFPAPQQLVADGLVHQRDLVAFVAKEAGLGFWDPTSEPVSTLVLAMLPLDLVQRLRCLAIRVEDTRLVVAFAELPSEDVVGQVHDETRWRVTPVLASGTDLDRAIANVYHLEVPDDQADDDGTPKHTYPPVDELLAAMVALGASDLHLSSGRPPSVRIDGTIQPLEGYGTLTPADLRDMIYAILPQRSRERFETELELD
ncbi:MAG: GspE/PulE/PilB domain-containing protein, partial [Acidimicrobiales bacterium]